MIACGPEPELEGTHSMLIAHMRRCVDDRLSVTFVEPGERARAGMLGSLRLLLHRDLQLVFPSMCTCPVYQCSMCPMSRVDVNNSKPDLITS